MATRREASVDADRTDQIPNGSLAEQHKHHTSGAAGVEGIG